MYTALEAYFSLYLAFYKLDMTRFIDDKQEVVKRLKEAVMNAISNVSNYVKKTTNDHVMHNHEYVLDGMRSIKFTAIQNAFDKSLKN